MVSEASRTDEISVVVRDDSGTLLKSDRKYSVDNLVIDRLILDSKNIFEI